MGQTLYFNGNIITVNDKQPSAEAVLTEEGLIKAVGNIEELKAQMDTGAEKFDLAGRTMIPGFVDPHSHVVFCQLFPRFDGPPVGDIDTIDKLVDSAKAYLEKNPVTGDNWFVGMGYDNIPYPEHKHPTMADMDRISMDFPVVMMHSSGHIGVCNSKTFEVIGITKDTPNPDGGAYQRDAQTGELTGLVEESALTQVVLGNMPKITAEFTAAGVLRAQAMYLKYGVTTAQDGSFDATSLPLLQHLHKQGLLHLDIYTYPPLDSPLRDYMLGVHSNQPEYKDGARFAGVKLFLDGSPQAKTAWLTKPYYIVPDGEEESYCGYPTYADDNKLCEFFKDCLRNGWQPLAHSNGDAAIDQFINQFEKAQKETGIYDDIRPVVIHCQTVREDQLDRMKELGLIPSFFHDHVLFWGDWHLDSVFGPERGSRISPLASAVKRGMKFTMHQDTPVAPPNMLLTIHNAVNRKTRSGRDIGPEFAIDPMEALRALTIYSAYQCFEENSKGSIEPGKVADFAILEKNLLEVPKETIRDIKVLQTIKSGKVVYSIEE